MSAARRDLPPPFPRRPAAMLRSPAMDALRAKYGKYLPHQRSNVDQVPLPFVNDMETTYEEVGAKRVCINQQGPTLGKRQATGQVCFRPEANTPSLERPGHEWRRFLQDLGKVMARFFNVSVF